MAPGTESGWTTYIPTKEKMFIYDASKLYQEKEIAVVDPGRQRVRIRLIA